MPNDNHDTPHGDSHGSLTSAGNDGESTSVEADMDARTHMTQGHEDQQPDSTDTRSSDIESAPFDYDSYYATAPRWEPEPEPAASSTPVPHRPARDGLMYFVGALAAAILGAALTVGILAATGTLSTENAAPVTTTTAAQTSEPTAATEPTEVINNTIVNEADAAVDPAAVAIKTLPSVVTITTFIENGDATQFTATGSGSGVVISEDGYIATNEHVVADASNMTVTFEDGRVYEAELVGEDALTDLAVIKINATGLTPIEFGSTDDLHVGDPAVAVGNPLGQLGGASISSGIVSAFDRRVDFSASGEDSLFGMLQTDAAINNGSSGGALVNSEGQLIGITAAIGVSQSGPEGIGYAIPVELVQRITSEIIETGDVEHPFLGVTILDYTEVQADGASLPSGAEIRTIEGNDSAAGKAGLEEGDIIVSIGDRDIRSQNDLILAVRLYRVGDEVPFVVIRDGEIMTFDVVMGQRPTEFRG